MRKFKIKNRPKRKYTRRQLTTGLYVSLSRNATVGLLPFLFLAIIFSANVVINLRPIDQNIFTIFRHPLFTFSFQDMIAASQHLFAQALQTASKQHITLKVSQPTFPTVSFSITNILLIIWYSLSSLGITIANSFLFIYAFIKQLALALNPSPLFPIIGTSTINILLTLENAILLSISAITHVGQLIGTDLVNIIMTTWNIIVSTAVFIGNAIVYFVTTVFYVLQVIAQAFTFAVIFIFNGIVFLLDSIFNAIVWVLKGVWYFITLPFVILWGYLLKLTPIWQFLKNNFDLCFQTIATGFNGIGAVISLLLHH